ncbi:transposable element Tcb1 transposase [Trichonephila clavipes]|nr:transposable element Tcb1 transposase [Trichonephila clavipes]
MNGKHGQPNGTILFLLTKCFSLQHRERRISVWRHRGERLLNCCVMHHLIGPAPGIMIELFPWLACFPDLPPIKNVWFTLAQRFVWGTPHAATPDQIWQYVEAVWTAVSQGNIRNLLESILRRVTAVIANNGSYTNYIFCQYPHVTRG